VKTEQSMEHGDEAGGRESFICSGWALACVCDGARYLLDGEEGDGREGGGWRLRLRRRSTTRGDGRSIAARAFPNCGSLPWHCHGVQYLCQRQQPVGLIDGIPTPGLDTSLRPTHRRYPPIPLRSMDGWAYPVTRHRQHPSSRSISSCSYLQPKTYCYHLIIINYSSAMVPGR
jgi:hypothetical protein